MNYSLKQVLLATALVALPVTAFTGYNLLSAKAATKVHSSEAHLGDLSALSTIISDVQAIVAKGDLAAAKARIKDFEVAWDQAEPSLKPLDPVRWGDIDSAADAAFSSIRAKSPDPAAVIKTLAALQASLGQQASVKP